MSQPPFIPTSILRGRDGTDGTDGSNVLPTDVAIAQAIADEDSDTYAGLVALIGQVGVGVGGDIGPLPAGKGVILKSPNGATTRRVSIDNDGLLVSGDPEFGTGYQAEVLTDAPMAYWRFGEASGTTAIDLTGNHTGTYAGGVTLGTPGLVDDDPDTGITLDGTNDHVVVNASGPIISGLTNWTIEAIVKPTTSEKVFYSERGSSGLDLLSFKLGGGGRTALQYRDHAGTLDDLQATDTGLLDGNKHHVVITKNGATVKIYDNGALIETFTLTASNTFGEATTQSWVGADATGASYMGGIIDELALYDHAILSTRVLAHFNAANTSGGFE